jgi:putative oxidoreductase
VTKETVLTTIMRVVLGILLVAHGINKLQMGLGNVEAWFNSMGIPGFLAYGVVAIELVGGLFLIIGLFTRYVAALVVLMLVGAILSVKLPAGLLGNGEGAGYELDLSFIVIAIYLMFTGKSPLSADQLFSRKRSA